MTVVTTPATGLPSVEFVVSVARVLDCVAWVLSRPLGPAILPEFMTAIVRTLRCVTSLDVRLIRRDALRNVLLFLRRPLSRFYNSTQIGRVLEPFALEVSLQCFTGDYFGSTVREQQVTCWGLLHSLLTLSVSLSLSLALCGSVGGLSHAV